MKDLKYFEGWNQQIFETQNENKLIDLNNVQINNQYLGKIFTDILYKKQNIHPFPYSIFKIYDEFIAISKDIKYVTGILFFLRPHIINTEESDGQYFQNLADRRYLEYSTFGMQSVYNFWDRLGDLLFLFFTTNIKPKDVYFGTLFNRIAEKYKATEPYIMLKELYDEMKLLFDLRHQAVHHFQIETLHYWGNIQHTNDEVERNKLNAQKFSYPEKLKRALEVSNNAFIAAIELIDKLPDIR